MHINRASIFGLLRELITAEKKGDHWVVFTPNDGEQGQSLFTVPSFQQAQDRCIMERLKEFDEEYLLYRYAPTSSFITALKQELGLLPRSFIDERAVENLLKDQGVKNISLESIETIGQGYYQPVRLEHAIIPNEHADRYQVDEHRYPSGTYYEIGHAHRTIASTNNYETALRIFNDRSAQLSTAGEDERTTVLLQAIFKDQTLRVNMEGLADENTGVTLLENISGKNERETKEHHLLDAPFTLQLWPLVKYHPEAQQLQYYNHQFQPIDPIAERYYHDWEKLQSHPQINPFQHVINHHHAYLGDLLLKHGIDHSAHASLLSKMEKGHATIYQVYPAGSGIDSHHAALTFRRSLLTGEYQLEKFYANRPLTDNVIAHYGFNRFHNEPSLRVDQAMNLMAGRAVLITDTPTPYWLQKEFTPIINNENSITYKIAASNYPMEDMLAKKGIVAYNDPEQRRELISGLERGDRMPVQFIGNNITIEGFIEASPRFNAFQYYNAQQIKTDYFSIQKPLQHKTVVEQQTQHKGRRHSL